MSTAKHDVKQLLNKLPDDCTVEDVQYHLYVLDKVRRGLEDARTKGTVTHEEAETRLAKWLTE
jgi:predicted transcriptional regulator